MSNKQIMESVFDNEFNANEIRNQILLKSESKNKKKMVKSLKYAIPIFVIVSVSSFMFLNNKQASSTFSDDVSNIIVNQVDSFDLTKVNADIKLTEINSVYLPWFNMFNDINIPNDLDKFYGYGVYTKNDYNKDYNILDSYVYEYFNLSNDRKIKIAFSNRNKPIRDYFFDSDDFKVSYINDNELIIYQSENIYFVEFKYNEYYFNIETQEIIIDELITLLTTIIK